MAQSKISSTISKAMGIFIFLFVGIFLISFMGELGTNMPREENITLTNYSTQYIYDSNDTFKENATGIENIDFYSDYFKINDSADYGALEIKQSDFEGEGQYLSSFGFHIENQTINNSVEFSFYADGSSWFSIPAENVSNHDDEPDFQFTESQLRDFGMDNQSFDELTIEFYGEKENTSSTSPTVYGYGGVLESQSENITYGEIEWYGRFGYLLLVLGSVVGIIIVLGYTITDRN